MCPSENADTHLQHRPVRPACTGHCSGGGTGGLWRGRRPTVDRDRPCANDLPHGDGHSVAAYPERDAAYPERDPTTTLLPNATGDGHL